MDMRYLWSELLRLCSYLHRQKNSGVWCQKQISQAGISNCTQQCLMCTCFWHPTPKLYWIIITHVQNLKTRGNPLKPHNVLLRNISETQFIMTFINLKIYTTLTDNLFVFILDDALSAVCKTFYWWHLKVGTIVFHHTLYINSIPQAHAPLYSTKSKWIAR